MTDKAVIYPLLKGIVEDLTHGKYKEIVDSKRNGRLTKEEIINAINEYHGKICLPPEESYNNFRQYDYNGNPEECAVEYDLWFDNKQSDLTLEVEIIKDNGGKYNICIQGIHVL